MNARQSYREAATLARTNRHNPLWFGQFFRFLGGTLYLADSGNIILNRDGIYSTQRPGFAVGGIGTFTTRLGRASAVHRSRDFQRVPLP